MAKESKKARRRRELLPGHGQAGPLSQFVRGKITAETYFSLTGQSVRKG